MRLPQYASAGNVAHTVCANNHAVQNSVASPSRLVSMGVSFKVLSSIYETSDTPKAPGHSSLRMKLWNDVQ